MDIWERVHLGKEALFPFGPVPTTCSPSLGLFGVFLVFCVCTCLVKESLKKDSFF